MHVCVVDIAGNYGPLNSYLELVRPLSRLGWRFTFVVPGQVADNLKGMYKSLDVVTVPVQNIGCRDSEVAKAVRIAFAGGADLVHANTTSAARGAVLAALIGWKPLVLHLRNSKLSNGERFFVTGVSVLPINVKFVAVSSAAAEVAGRRIKRLARVIPDAVSPLPRRASPTVAGAAHVGIVVNQQPTKGFDVFVDIVEATMDVQVVFEVFGSAGVEPPANEMIRRGRERLKAMGADSRVIFHGIVPGIGDRYQMLDAVLITSRRESFSRVAAEAMIAAVPLVAPRIPGLTDTVGSGRYALMYEPGNGADAAHTLKKLLLDYEVSISRAEESCQWALSTFNGERIAAEMDSVYRSVCGVG